MLNDVTPAQEKAASASQGLTFHLGEVLLHFPGARFAVQGYLEHNHHLVKEMPMQTALELSSMETHAFAVCTTESLTKLLQETYISACNHGIWIKTNFSTSPGSSRYQTRKHCTVYINPGSPLHEHWYEYDGCY
uniref:Uncharacterized protein n=1 Tax=Zea mays TaxID=4577 RepID=A0A804P6M1_MAIZE